MEMVFERRGETGRWLVILKDPTVRAAQILREHVYKYQGDVLSSTDHDDIFVVAMSRSGIRDLRREVKVDVVGHDQGRRLQSLCRKRPEMRQLVAILRMSGTRPASAADTARLATAIRRGA